MARYFAPQAEYKAPELDELIKPLEIYRQAYDKTEEKYDAQREKAAMIQAMLGTNPDNELSNYMSDYNKLMDDTVRGLASNNLSLAQLTSNYKNLQAMWLDKGLKANAAIDAYTKYREAKTKDPGAIGPDYTIGNFLKNPNLEYAFFDPDKVYAAGALAGKVFSDRTGIRSSAKGPNGTWIDTYGPTDSEIAGIYTDNQNPFYDDADALLRRYGVDPDSDNGRIFKNAYAAGVRSSQTQKATPNVNYITAAQRMNNDYDYQNYEKIIGEIAEKQNKWIKSGNITTYDGKNRQAYSYMYYDTEKRKFQPFYFYLDENNDIVFINDKTFNKDKAEKEEYISKGL